MLRTLNEKFVLAGSEYQSAYFYAHSSHEWKYITYRSNALVTNVMYLNWQHMHLKTSSNFCNSCLVSHSNTKLSSYEAKSSEQAMFALSVNHVRGQNHVECSGVVLGGGKCPAPRPVVKFQMPHPRD